MADWGSSISGSTYGSPANPGPFVPSAAAHTKGGWADFITPVRTGAIVIGVDWGQTYTTHRTMLFDFAVGTAGNEKIFLENLMCAYSAIGNTASREQSAELVLPIILPNNQLLRVRCQSSYASNAGAYLVVRPYDTPSSWVGSVIDTYGADTANSAGTTMTANSASYTYGSYAQITASCERMECFFVAIAPRVAQSAFSIQGGTWEVAIGGAGAEINIAQGNVGSGTATQLSSPQFFGPFYHQISSGQRLSARLMREGTTSQRTLDIIVYGVR